jgi:vitamin B12 transporter
MSKTFTLPAALLFCSIAFAQKDTVRTTILDEVIVTANKTEQKQSTTGKVITVITKAQIEKSSGKTVAQLLNEQAGITINGALSNAGAVQTVFMRGAAAGRTLILMDGIPVNDPSQITNDFDLNFFSINDVERIEICKGAQSTLYGSDAIAGVINIITTKSNITKPINVKATVTGGSFGTLKTNLQVYGKADKLPIPHVMQDYRAPVFQQPMTVPVQRILTTMRTSAIQLTAPFSTRPVNSSC